MLGNVDHPFFRPAWRRAVVVLICLVWAIVEFATATPFWGMIALGFAAYGYWIFFHTYPGNAPAQPEDTDLN